MSEFEDDLFGYEFELRREGMQYALQGGVWFHRHVYRGEPMAHVVSSDRELLLTIGARLGLREAWLQYKPLKDPTTGVRVEAWHWDLRRRYLWEGLRMTGSRVAAGTDPPRGPRSPLG